MKFTILFIFLFIVSGCVYKHNVYNDLITIDVTKTDYPKKELLIQDFMDVEYIALETKDNFYNQGLIQDIGQDIILVTNRNDDGDIFVYNRSGKALRKINRKGQGGEEYIDFTQIVLDEVHEEIFVNDILSRKILVYDLFGKYKRSINPKKGYGSKYYTNIFNYDRDNLICYDKYNKENAFVLVSKRNGSITKEVRIPIKEKILIYQINGSQMVTPGYYPSIIPYNDDWVLVELSSDTIYTLSRDNNLNPFLVRTPPTQSR